MKFLIKDKEAKVIIIAEDGFWNGALQQNVKADKKINCDFNQEFIQIL